MNINGEVLAELKPQIELWIKDFEKTQPRNIEIDTDTFEGSAYDILSCILQNLED